MGKSGPITIRSYRPEDHDVLLALIRELQGHERAYEPLMKPEAEIGSEYIAKLESDAAAYGGQILMAEDAGRPIGYATIFTHVPSEDEDEVPYTYALVSDVAVTGDQRGKGIGRRLLETCEDVARQAGAERLRIFVLSQNQRARNLYGAFGFAERVTEMEKPLN